MKLYFVYILKCSDRSYYTGVTSDLDKRLIEHEEGKYKESYTYSKRPIELVFYCSFTNVEIAIEKEKQIKKWSRSKKEALINNEFDKLPNLSKKKFVWYLDSSAELDSVQIWFSLSVNQIHSIWQKEK